MRTERSLTVPSAIFGDRLASYDSPVFMGESPAPDSNRRPLPYHDSSAHLGSSDDAMAGGRNARSHGASGRVEHGRDGALESAVERARVPSQFLDVCGNCGQERWFCGCSPERAT